MKLLKVWKELDRNRCILKMNSLCEKCRSAIDQGYLDPQTWIYLCGDCDLLEACFYIGKKNNDHNESQTKKIPLPSS